MAAGRWCLLVAAVAVGALLGSSAVADQRDSRLPSLFRELAAAKEARAAEPIETRIWAIWLTPPGGRDVAGAMNRGLSAMAAGRPREALLAFDAVVRLAPDFAEGWNKRATVRYALGDLDGSALDIYRTLALEPRHFGALSGLGLVRLAQDRPADALAAFEAALAIHPTMVGAGKIGALRDRVRGRPL